MNSTNLVFIPFAYLDGAESSQNVKREKNIKDLYIKNAFVALMSLKCSKDVDVAIVTNCAIKENYLSLFIQNNIKVIRCEFNSFRFSNTYPWCLAFYKFCAFEYVVRNYKYKQYMMLDADVYAMQSVSSIFTDLKDKILFYNHGGTICVSHSYETIDTSLLPNITIKRSGGEFLASNYNNALIFIKLAKQIFTNMFEQNIIVSYGDEYISSIVAKIMKNAYFIDDSVARCWTGSYRCIPKSIRNSLILHVPAEKRYGMLKLYKFIVKHGVLPANEYAIKKLHIEKASFPRKIKQIIVKTFGNKHD